MKNCGIYKIVNIKNNKIYVGSSVNLKSRKYSHFNDLNKNKHCNNYLQGAYNKHGKDNFKWEVIERIVFNEDKQILKNNLLGREQYYLDLYESYNPKKGYNLCPKAGSRLGSEVSEETKVKPSKAHKGKKLSEETKQKIIEALKGRPVSQETKDKIGASNSIALMGKTLSEEHRKKISEANIGREVSRETRDKISIKHKGKKISRELVEKLRRINKGRKLTEEQRKRVSEFHKGRIKSEQECINISFSKKGEKHHFYGKTLSEEHRNKIGESGKGRVTSEETKQKISEAKKGHEVSEETRDKIRESLSKIREQRVKHFVEIRGRKVINLTTNEIFDSMTSAANKYNVHRANIRRVCRGIYKTTGGYKWAYV